MNLSRIVQDISTSRSYKNFDMAYTDVPIEESRLIFKKNIYLLFLNLSDGRLGVNGRRTLAID